MALREVRLYVYTGDRELDNEISKDIYHPFTFYMDTLMRGRFKEYSGEEVKGINLVNLMLYTPAKIQEIRSRGFGEALERFDEWHPALNTLQLESFIELYEIQGNRTEKLSKAIDIFISYASKSDLPQMKKLVSHLEESVGKQSLEDAFLQADKYLEKLFSP